MLMAVVTFSVSQVYFARKLNMKQLLVIYASLYYHVNEANQNREMCNEIG